MHAIIKLARLILVGGAAALLGCDQPIPVDYTGGDLPPEGVIEGTVNYIGPPPCSQNGHVVGNAVLLVFDARNPPPPAGLGVTAANFGVVSGDVLFKNWPVTQGATKICPPADAAQQTVSASYAISPMFAGQYVIQAFFDYTGDFFATFKFRQLPEATDIGGGYIDLTDAEELVPNFNDPQKLADGGKTYPLEPKQANPNYQPIFLPVNIGTQGATPPTSLWDVPTFTMPDTGYLADNVTVTIAEALPFSRPYFYATGVPQAPALSTITVGIAADGGVTNTSSADRPGGGTIASAATPQNPNGDVDYIPILSFPQDIQVYAQPSVPGVGLGGADVVTQFQSALPEVTLTAGVPGGEQCVAADIANVGDPFHMQLGTSLTATCPASDTPAPGGNGGFFVWWNGNHQDSECGNVQGCGNLLDYIPEAPGEVFRMWPLVVLAKLEDLPVTTPPTPQPNPNDPQGLLAQGSDLTKPIVIIQGITMYQGSFLNTSIAAQMLPGGVAPPLTYPDPTNFTDSLSFLVRPSTLCLDPRAPDYGGVLVTPGVIGTDGTVTGQFPPADTYDPMNDTPATVINSTAAANPQLSKLVNTNAAGSTHGLVGGCLPMGRYQINLVYPSGQAWTTPNEVGSCAAAEGSTVWAKNPGTCSTQPRPTLYSQGTRAVVEITKAQNENNCKSATPPSGGIPAGVMPDGKTLTADGSPFACSGLCSDPTLDPTASPPCSVKLK